MSDENNIFVVSCETLGLYDDAAILSIGLVYADIDKEYTFDELRSLGAHLKLSVQDQIYCGRKRDGETMKWWSEQHPIAKQVLMAQESDISVASIPSTIISYFRWRGYNDDLKDLHGYHRGGPTGFRFGKINHLYKESAGVEMPFNRNNLFDIRTALCHVGHPGEIISPNDIGGFTPHNALHEAIIDFMRLQKAFIE